MTSYDFDAVKAAAEARAHADVQTGIRNLLAAYAKAPEYDSEDNAVGKSHITTPRASIRGHLLRLGIDPDNPPEEYR